MSWSGFKKNVGRATTQVMMKTGHVEKTSDRDYEVEERRYRTLESASLRLQKEAKGYLDSLRAMTASQMRIAETIDAFYGESGAKDGVSRSYKQAVEDLDAETVKALDGPYRCVTRDPEFIAMVKDDQYLYPPGVLDSIETDLNWKRRNKTYSKHMDGQRESLQLIEYVYRTTVLEPINRFCAYFPDINECIKKRNHKMLDYDSMRSKVKKLTEKPDKDPSKLPRTEKETEMVNDALSFLQVHGASNVSGLPPECGPLLEDESSESLLLPSPPKALDGLKHNDRLASIKADEDAALRSIGMKRTSSIVNAASRINRAFWGLPPDAGFGQQSMVGTPSSKDRKNSLAFDGNAGASSTDAPPRSPHFLTIRGGGMIPPVSPHSTHSPTMRSVMQQRADETPTRKTASLVPNDSTPQKLPDLKSSSSRKRGNQEGIPASPVRRGSSRSSTTSSTSTMRPSLERDVLRPDFLAAAARLTRTPFFHPSELEEIMAPLKAEFLERQTDQLEQAKAAYLQLNEQLTNELPQLIDLRVPYLDPSFEALVKIQLRFCAEAYSRMAQVQQYLDASTRDQYANGDLDARVEDVLGQIRELSIAGTV